MTDQQLIKNILYYSFVLISILFISILSTVINYYNSHLFFSLSFNIMILIIIYFTHYIKRQKFHNSLNNKIASIIIVYWLQSIIFQYILPFIDKSNNYIFFIYLFSPFLYLFIILILLKNKTSYISKQNEYKKPKKLTIAISFFIYFFIWFFIIFINFLFFKNNITLIFYIPFLITIILLNYFIYKWNYNNFNCIFNKRIIVTFILLVFHCFFTLLIYKYYPYFYPYYPKYILNYIFYLHNLIFPLTYLGFLLFFLFAYKSVNKKLL